MRSLNTQDIEGAQPKKVHNQRFQFNGNVSSINLATGGQIMNVSTIRSTPLSDSLSAQLSLAQQQLKTPQHIKGKTGGNQSDSIRDLFNYDLRRPILIPSPQQSLQPTPKVIIVPENKQEQPTQNQSARSAREQQGYLNPSDSIKQGSNALPQDLVKSVFDLNMPKRVPSRAETNQQVLLSSSYKFNKDYTGLQKDSSTITQQVLNGYANSINRITPQQGYIQTDVLNKLQQTDENQPSNGIKQQEQDSNSKQMNGQPLPNLKSDRQTPRSILLQKILIEPRFVVLCESNNYTRDSINRFLGIRNITSFEIFSFPGGPGCLSLQDKDQRECWKGALSCFMQSISKIYKVQEILVFQNTDSILAQVQNEDLERIIVPKEKLLRSCYFIKDQYTFPVKGFLINEKGIIDKII